MPNVMAALPNIGGALCGSSVIPLLVPLRKVWLLPAAGLPCSNAAKTRNPLKFVVVPQTPEPISAVSGPNFAISWGHVGRYCCLWSPYVIGQTIIFSSCFFFLSSFFLLLLFFPRLISAVGDWMFTILWHMVWP